MGPYRISEVAKRTGFSTSTLRFYEQVGVLSETARTPTGYRLYDDRAIERLRFVARAKQLGLTLEEITELASLWDDDQCAPVQHRLAQLVAEKSDQIAEQIHELSAFAVQLAEVRERLASTAVDGPCDDDCGCGPIHPVTLGRQPDADVPIACTLSPSLMDSRIEEWQTLLVDVVERVEIDDGLRVIFGSAAAATVADLAQRELECCAFFEFNVGFSDGRVTLDVQAPHDARSIIDEFFGASV